MKQRMHLLLVVFVLGLVGITTSAQTPIGSVQAEKRTRAKLRFHVPIKTVSIDMKMFLSTE